ncbi:hypothetical protein [Desulfosporosinus sp. OT]|uniref:hypothetical protein n=1 Tax=Desulfosporosinus sp. OT TaxID=913865 RepID=UPI001300BF35|nr:hypothetical protein [Desulfosporosinus sp. OT]
MKKFLSPQQVCKQEPSPLAPGCILTDQAYLRQRRKQRCAVLPRRTQARGIFLAWRAL